MPKKNVSGYDPGLTGSAKYWEEADLSANDHTFDPPARAILITGNGTLSVTLAEKEDDDLDLGTVQASPYPIPLQVHTVRMTGTTATVVGLW